MADEIDEQIVFFRRQMQFFAARFDNARFEIDLKIAGLKNLDLMVGASIGAPQRGPHSSQQFVHADPLRLPPQSHSEEAST